MPKVKWAENLEETEPVSVTTEEPRAKVKESGKGIKKSKEYTASFISSKKGLKLWIKGPLVNIIPGVGRHIVQGSGDFVEFKQGKYQTSDKGKIKYLLGHRGFAGNSGNWFFPDPADPTGFWLDRGYYKEEMVKTRTPADPGAVIEEGKKQAVKVAGRFAKAEMESLRTSNVGGG